MLNDKREFSVLFYFFSIINDIIIYMEEVLNKKEKTKLKEKISAFIQNVFSSNKKALIFLSILMASIMLVYFIVVVAFRHNFYNNWSDDAVQYYPFMCDFINKLKSGELSWYSFKNYLGSSIFSDTYYIPLDGFTLIILLFSFIMPTEIAMSIVEIIKLIAGAIALGAYLGIKGYRPKVTFLISLMYFSSSGITCFSCFPCFTSLAFYLPASLIIGHYFLRGKWYFVPLFSMIVVFYNFYLAYTVFAFMAFSMLFMVFIEKKKLYKSLLELLSYVCLIVLGLLMAFVIFLPSINFVLQSTSRNVAGGGSIKGLLLILSTYIDIAFTFIVCSFKALIGVITTPKGFFAGSQVIEESFIQLRYLCNTLRSSRTIDDIKVMQSLFNIEEYYRVLSTTFTPLTPSSFYGYQSSYFLEHISLYITGIGLVLSTYVWSMNYRRSNIYKIALILSVIMMALPFFSYILSANLEVLYTRWFNVCSIPILLIAGHVVNENGLYDLKKKPLIIGLLILLYLGIFGAYHHLANIRSVDYRTNIDERIINFDNNLFYLTVAALLVLLIASVVFQAKKDRTKEKTRKTKLMTILLVVFFSLVFLGICATLLVQYLSVSDFIFSISRGDSSDLFSVDAMVVYQYLSLLILAIMIAETFFILNKKKVLFAIIFAIEVIISGCASFGASVVLEGKETTFKNTRNLSNFLEEYIDEPSTYRIYVDSSIDNILRTNLSSMMPTACNTNVFHSFIYAGTDGVADLIFNISDEGQAGKKALNTYSYYLNVFLGYKYVVASSKSSFINYDTNQFELVNIDDTEDYLLLKFKDYEEFLVYDECYETETFKNTTKSLNEISRTKELTKAVVIDLELLEKLDDYSLIERKNSVDEISSSEIVNQKLAFAVTNKSIVNVDGKLYYKYDFKGKDEITTRSYAINLFGLEERANELVEGENIYLEYANGEKLILKADNISNKNGSTFHIPVYGHQDKSELKPKSLYILALDQENEELLAPSLSYTFEAILPPSSSIESYENGEPLKDGEGLSAALRFYVDNSYENSAINIVLRNNSSKQISYNTMYFEYDDGTIEIANNESVVNKNIKFIYIIKPGDIYSMSYPPSIKITTYSIDEKYADNKDNKIISTEGSKITIKYDNKTTEEGYEVIMIPTAYSEEWQIINGDVKKIISVNGGLIGLIVPKNINSNEITLKFEPKGIKLGSIISLISIIFYLLLLAVTILIKRKRKEAQTCQL